MNEYTHSVSGLPSQLLTRDGYISVNDDWMNRPETACDGYLPALDGLRAVAILLVMLSHVSPQFSGIFPGILGVVVFFVISGFLITRQLAAEIEESGRFDIGMFYLRRILRLMPTLLIYLIFFVPMLSFLGVHITPVHIASAVFYFANYYGMFAGYPPYNPVPITWSLSVEEHYYILFPFVMLAFRRDMKKILPLLAGLFILAIAWRADVYHLCMGERIPICGISNKTRAQGTDIVFDCILYGAFALIILRHYPKETCRLLINPRALATAILLILAALVLREPFFRATLRYSLEAAASAVILLNVAFGKDGRIKKLLSGNGIRFIGKISYALYLAHFGVLISMEAAEKKQGLDTPADVTLYFLLSFLLACGAYFLVEKPLIKIRRKLGAAA